MEKNLKFLSFEIYMIVCAMLEKIFFRLLNMSSMINFFLLHIRYQIYMYIYYILL